MTWGAIGGAAVATVGGALLSKGGSSQSGTQTQTTQQVLDPRIQQMLFGDGTGTGAGQGLLSQYQGYLNQPQGAGTAAYGQQAQDFLKNNAGGITGQLQGAATGLLGGGISAPQSQAAQAQGAQAQMAPQMQAAQSNGNNGRAGILWNAGETANAASVNAPPQNNTDLTGAYNKFVNGDAGANPYLTGALQAGVDATNAGYNKNVNTLTDQLQRNVLPGIRSNSVLAGQYGGTRQGIAEGNAIGDFTRQLNDNNAQLAATNSANTTGAQAQAFNQGQDRALAATQGLGAQQYGVAGQNAAMQQAANMQTSAQKQQANLQNQMTGNQTAQFDATQSQQNNQFNAGLLQQAAQANQGATQQNNQFNAGLQQQTGQYNAGLQQQTGLANQTSQLQTNGLNSNNTLGGMAGLSGLLASQYGAAQGQDNYGINRAGQVNGLLAPYLSANGGSTSSAPLYQNQGANILGGATAGLGLFNGLKGASSGSYGGFLNNNSGLNMSPSDLYSIFG